MNTLLQDESLLIGSREEIQKLATKDSARILVVSDSHGAYSNLLLILRQFGVVSDALVFCGDGICDISKLISNAVDEAEIKAIIPPVIGIVEGNNDADLYPVRNVLSDEPYYVQWKVPIFNVLEACGQRIFFTHGHRNSLYLGTGEIISAAKKSNCKIALYGHIHIAAEKLGEVFTINPGSCFRPRGGQKPSFAMLNLTKNIGFECIFYELSSLGSKPFFPARTF
ncbi:MAG: YfcE family phosphodiesterase [Treponema succinifaciens]|uniref:YfcE family phosphodiesterase n=1 Tax=Treponema succinifaciens TaxID=167 RepID=UPI002A75A610|nr:YfcE family phosphodiesterase [Treponema succinifaciens]MDY2616807.1 YfcE family phosphodiesterase [Treponema succinifaciens]